MPMPVLSFRAAPEHAPLLRQLAAGLRRDPDLARRLEAVLAGAAVEEDGTGGRHNYGPFAGERVALAVLRDALVARLDPEEIRLFGSRGHGRARADSDFDLLVIFPDAAGEAALDPRRAYAPLLGLGIGCDVVPCLRGDYEAEKDIPGTVAHEAATGRLVYRRTPTPV